MKIAIKRAGGHDPALGPKHPANQDPTLEAHVVEIITVECPGWRHYWLCSCGASGLPKDQVRPARNGGARHVAAMEKR